MAGAPDSRRSDAPRLTRVCVYAGSRPGRRERFAAAATALGGLLAREGIELVYGGGSRGLMGVLADAALAAGGHVTGIIPAHLAEREAAHQGLSELLIVRSMHERKLEMAERADAFIALPGGTGTLEELIEMLTWAQLGLHSKPIGLLNVEGYYDQLIAFLDVAVREQLLSPADRDWLSVGREPERVLAELRSRSR
jgi:uncharacterized protein (TIGR00730 family)